jgi:hypothetical protein
LRGAADRLDPGILSQASPDPVRAPHHALRLLGRSELISHAERGLVAYLRREAAAVFDLAELMARCRSWLVEHQYLLLRERDIRRLSIAARRHQERALFKIIATAVPPERDLWVPGLLAPMAA